MDQKIFHSFSIYIANNTWCAQVLLQMKLLERSMCKLCADICFHFLQMNTRDHGCWVSWWEYTLLCGKLPTCLLKWLCHLFPISNEWVPSGALPVSSCLWRCQCSGFGCCNRHVEVSCSSYGFFLGVYDMGYIFAICVSSLVSYLLRFWSIL